MTREFALVSGSHVIPGIQKDVRTIQRSAQLWGSSTSAGNPVIRLGIT